MCNFKVIKLLVLGSLVLAVSACVETSTSRSSIREAFPKSWIHKKEDPQVIAAFNAIAEDDIPSLRRMLVEGLPANSIITAEKNEVVVETSLLATAVVSGVYSENDYQAVEVLLDHNADPDVGYVKTDSNGVVIDVGTPLQLAIERTKVDPEVQKIADLLLSRGASARFVHGAKAGPLELAIRHELPDLIPVLIRHGADLNQKNSKGAVLLSNAITNGASLKMIETLLDSGADPNLRGSNGVSPLHYAITKKREDLVGTLLQAGAKLIEKTPSGYSYLQVAISFKNIEIVKRLLLADSQAWGRHKTDVLIDLVGRQDDRSFHLNVAKLLIDAGANVDGIDGSGRSILARAVALGDDDFVGLLLLSGADPNLQTSRPLVLFSLLSSYSPSVLKMLHDGGINLDSLDSNGNTLLSIAVERGRSSMAVDLLELGANPDLGLTVVPLVEAAKKSNEVLVAKLLRNGAQPDMRDSEGNNALHWSAIANDQRIASMLLEAGTDPVGVNKHNQTPIDIATSLENFAFALAVAKYIEEAEPSARGYNEVQSEYTSAGSGFFVTDKNVVTNAHVVQSCKEIYVVRGGNHSPSELVAANSSVDLALLKSSIVSDAFLSIRSDPARVGDDVIVLGYPLPDALGSSMKATTGIVSGLTGVGGDISQMQISAAIQPGNSGGPVLDDSGDLVAIAVSKLDDLNSLKETGSVPQNVNFAIKTSVLQMFLNSHDVQPKLARSGKRHLATADIVSRANEATVQVVCR